MLFEGVNCTIKATNTITLYINYFIPLTLTQLDSHSHQVHIFFVDCQMKWIKLTLGAICDIRLANVPPNSFVTLVINEKIGQEFHT